MIAPDFRWVSAMDPRPRPSHYAGLGNCRCALVPIRQGSWPQDVTVPPPPMRGRIVIYTPPLPELPDGVWDRGGVLMCECRVCERAMPIECEPEDFAPDMAYCGGSPRCCP